MAEIAVESPERARHHRVSGTMYVVTFVLLLVFTTASFFISYLQLGPWSAAIAFSISTIKAALVVFFFMHLLEQRSVNRLFLLIGVLFILLLVGLSVADKVTR
jgi:cytochrome c oxidase subunit 4